jgi:predicted acetyltransferase
MVAHVRTQKAAESIEHVAVVGVTPDGRDTLANLLQLYQDDFSAIEPSDVSGDGRFHQLDGVSFEHAYFVIVRSALAGFALVRRQPSQVVAGETVWSMAEFFIMRKYRRASIGTCAAYLVIERHPGTWEITQTPRNSVATAFWRRVLALYAFEARSYGNPELPRHLQRFSTAMTHLPDGDL